ncbi:MAG: type IX secretion system membrane protein PorP/SprF [Cyclobacteriaceae bacterium]
MHPSFLTGIVKSIVSIHFLFIFSSSLAQTRLPFNQMDCNLSLINPAMVGFEDGFLAKFGHQKLAEGFFGESNSTFIQLDWAFKTTDYISYHLRSLKLDNPIEFDRHELASEFAKGKSDRYGLGFFLGRDELGLSHLTSTGLRYSKHMQFGAKTVFAAGVSIGVNFNQLNGQVFQYDPRGLETSIERFIPLGLNSGINQTVDLGLMVYRKKSFIGYTLRNYVDNHKRSQAAYPGLNFHESIFLVGLNHFLFYPFKAKTIASIYLRKGVKARFQLGGKIEFKERLESGLMVDQDGNLIAQLGLLKSGTLKINYAFSLLRFNEFNSTNSNEIIVSLALPNREK